jgi:dihydrolipoamide dehydrogenase
MDYDLVVLGGGPAGYVGAIRAAQLGKKVACVEMERAGGTCLNWGCIPSKALLRSAELYHLMKDAGAYGLKAENVGYDFGQVMERSRGVADRMAKGIEYLFNKNKVEYFVGKGVIAKDRKVVVTEPKGEGRTLVAKNVLLATGCLSRELPGLPADGKRVHNSRTLLASRSQPKSIIVIGAGAIGVEFAYFLNAFGTEVTMVEMLPAILPIEDSEVSETLQKSFAKLGIKMHTGTKVENTEVHASGVRISVAGPTKHVLEAEAVLVAIGVQANLDGVLGEGLSLELVKGFVKTNDRYETNVKGIYGAGDIIGPPWLAHVASHEAIEAVEGMFDPKKKPHKVEVFPGCTYCHPQVASIGLTERAAKEKGLKFKVAKFPYRGNGKAVAQGDTEGFVKLVAGEPHGEILGAHIIGGEATELIAELGLAVTMEATLDELIATVHAHPTLSEMVHEAALAAAGRPLHIA